MTNFDKDYLELCKKILNEGKEVENRTGINTIKVYNIPISVDTIRRREPRKWTYLEGIKSLIVDTKWVF